MNLKELFELLEKEFVKEHRQMDLMNSEAIQERKKATSSIYVTDAAYYEEKAKRTQAQAQSHASICCKLAEILATANGTTQDQQTKLLYDKYNLWRD